MKWKSIIGILLVVLSVAGVICWESFGRDAVCSSRVVTASRDISAGSTVTFEDLCISNVIKEDVMPSALGEEAFYELIGKRAVADIAEGQQLTNMWFTDQPELIKDGESIFVIPSGWLYPMSSLLQSTDKSSIYLMPQKKLLGTYVLAVVGDGVEIVCSPMDYFKIYNLMQSDELSSLLIVAESAELRSLE